MKRTYLRAFTLVELLIVISVIAMLSSIIMANIESARAKGRDSLREQQTDEIDKAVQMYIDENGHAPYLTGCDVQTVALQAGALPNESDVSACFAVSTASIGSNSKNAWIDFEGQISPYIEDFPDDPCQGGCTNASGGQTGYTYSSPLVMQYLCGLNCSQTAGQLNSSYQVYSSLEKNTAYAGNTAPNSPNMTYDPNADRIAPTARVSYDYPSNYGYYGFTSRSVPVHLYGYSEPVTITNNNGSNLYTFTENGSFTFVLRDSAGNIGSTTASMSKIIKWSGTQSTSINWNDANTLCSQKDGGGVWRLPTTNELSEALEFQFDVSNTLGFYTNREYWSTYVIGNMAGTKKVDYSHNISSPLRLMTDRVSVNCVR